MSLMVLEATYVDHEIVTLLRPEFLINQGKFREAADLLEILLEKVRIIITHGKSYF